MQLFLEWARASRPGFELTPENAGAIAQVCARLDGIPLAIELAAARLRVLLVTELAVRLEDSLRLLVGGSRTVLPRQQTLRATLDWSFNLLEEPEQELLARLSVFRGGWTLEAAEDVCAGDGIEKRHVLDLLSGQVDKSLILMVQLEASTRYRLLETVRQYAAERLRGSPAEGVLPRRHAGYYLGLAERAEPELRGPGQGEGLEGLEEEHGNLRETAITRSATTPS